MTIRRYGVAVDADEKDAIAGYLDHYRALLVSLCEGLAKAELTRSTVPSGTSLLGLVKHMTRVESSWFTHRFQGEPVGWEADPSDPDADFRIEEDEDAASVIGAYEEECARSRAVLAAASLDDFARHPDYSSYKLRWIAFHMQEETARHVGHSDIIREQIDGRTGAGYG